MGQILVRAIDLAWIYVLHMRTIESFIYTHSITVNMFSHHSDDRSSQWQSGTDSDSLWGADLINGLIAIGHIREQALTKNICQWVICSSLREFFFLREISPVGPKSSFTSVRTHYKISEMISVSKWTKVGLTCYRGRWAVKLFRWYRYPFISIIHKFSSQANYLKFQWFTWFCTQQLQISPFHA